MLTLKALNTEINNNGLNGKELPKKLKLLNWGKTDTTDGPVYLTDYTVKVFEVNQKKFGRDEDVALDFDHCTVPDSKEYVKGKPKSIAAYGQPVLIKGDGLYLEDLEWTDMGVENAPNYKDLSPTVLLDAQGVVLGLHSAALTPNGAVYGLKFYEAKGIDAMIKKMTVSDQGSSQNNSEHITIKDASMDSFDSTSDLKKVYDKFPGNAGIKELSKEDPDDNDENKDNEDTVDKALCNYDADDHYSKYGDVTYADKENHKYPVDTEKHVRAAWSYINMPKNAGKYSSDKLSAIKGHIKNAAKKFDISISDSDEKTKTMSASSLNKEQDQYNNKNTNNMNDTKIKQMAAEISSELGVENNTLVERVLYAFLAKEVESKEYTGQITRKDNTDEGGLKQFSARFNEIENQIKSLRAEKDKQNASYEENEKNNLIKQAAREGKDVLKVLSVDNIKKLDVNILKDIVIGLPKTIPLNSTLRVLSSSNGVPEKTAKERHLDALDENIKNQMAITQ